MCTCNQSKDGLLANKLRFHHNERSRLLKELNDRGFTVYVKLEDSGIEISNGPSTITSIQKVETISL